MDMGMMPPGGAMPGMNDPSMMGMGMGAMPGMPGGAMPGMDMGMMPLAACPECRSIGWNGNGRHA